MKPTTDRAEVHRAIGQLQRLAEVFGRRRSQLAQAAGLSEQQWRVLEEIATEQFMPSMFARGRRSSAAAVSRIIRQLLDKGLASVSVSADDGRQRRYVLTAKGRRTLDTLRASRGHAIEAVWLQLDPKGLAAFTRFSADLVRRLEAYAAREP
jgi:DNA-binding MarR family transcriptional regulator